MKQSTNTSAAKLKVKKKKRKKKEKRKCKKLIPLKTNKQTYRSTKLEKRSKKTKNNKKKLNFLLLWGHLLEMLLVVFHIKSNKKHIGHHILVLFAKNLFGGLLKWFFYCNFSLCDLLSFLLLLLLLLFLFLFFFLWLLLLLLLFLLWLLLLLLFGGHYFNYHYL